MAHRENHEIRELASRLVSAADGITNSAAAGLEQDLREAADFMQEVTEPAPIMSRLTSELTKIANACPDAATARKLRRLLGGEA